MMIKNNLLINKIVFVILILAIVIASTLDAEARRKKRRSYNPKQTRQQAIEIIRSTSEEISQIAGLEPKLDAIDSTTKQIIAEDGEDLTLEGDHGEIIEELEKEDDVIVSMEDFNALWMSYLEDDADNGMTGYGIKKSDLMNIVMEWLGTPYRFGGTTRNAIDCSGFTQKVLLSAADILVPRVAREQVNMGRKVLRKNLQFGDLVFFHTYSKRFASHVGIYLGDDLFVHASSRSGVTVSSLESSYYKRTFISGRRLTSQDIAKYSIKPQEFLNAEKKSK